MFDSATEHLLNSSFAQGIFATDTDLKITFWNHWLESISGRRSSELIGMHLFEAFPVLVERHLDQYYRDALNGDTRLLAQKFHRYLLPMPPGNKNLPVEQMQQSARIAPIYKNNRIIGTITTIDDVTDRVDYEARLKSNIGELHESQLALQQKAEEAERANHAKDEILSVVSHELRTPLSAILGWTRMLLTAKLDEATARRALETIARNAKLQDKLINDLLDIGRIISGKFEIEREPVELERLIESCLEAVHPAAKEKQIDLEVKIDALPGRVAGDASRLQQVILNLLTNAIKFTPQDGRVKVSLSHKGSSAVINVSDTGVGINSEFLPYVFERFRQAKKAEAVHKVGLGLGLAIARQIVELHAGTIAAESPGENQGATFTVTLPIKD